ncbi:hypothetical protein ACOAKC_08275 [Hathewaya histolytica]|uniref:hypothetical protein n=1 Tax=Hathewaya histolytica TaxID=1498 RepID=UPI003B67304E
MGREALDILNIDKLTKHFYQKWMDTTVDFPMLNIITYEDKIKAEEETEKGIDNIFEFLGDFPKGENEKILWRIKFKKLAYDFSLRGYSKEHKKELEPYIDKFLKVMGEFTKSSKSFDSKLSYEEIWQAMRNVWALVLLQIIFDQEVGLTKGIFAYSLLYPYTDNYLDSSELSSKEKKEFNLLVKEKLEGKKVYPKDDISKKVVILLSKIEEQFERIEYDEVFKSLLAIQNAQEKSLHQQGEKNSLNEKKLLEISIEKGGTSVLVDGYLVKGKLNMDEIYFLFSFGVSLQIADDIQDIREDVREGHNTVVTKVGYIWNLDNLTKNLLNFTVDILKDLEKVNKDKNIVFENFVVKRAMHFVYFAITKNKKLYSSKFMNEFENYLPYTLKYMTNLNKNLNKKLKRTKRKLGDKRFKEVMEYIFSA